MIEPPVPKPPSGFCDHCGKRMDKCVCPRHESLKLKHAAERKRCSVRSVYNAIKAGLLPAHQLGGKGPFYVRVDDLDQWTPPDARGALQAWHRKMGHRTSHHGPARDVLVMMNDGRVIVAEMEHEKDGKLPKDAQFPGFRARLDANLQVYREI